MSTSYLEELLVAEGVEEGNRKSILEGVLLNIRSFIFASIELEKLTLYLVLKNNGGYRLFKTIHDAIIMEKLDNSYVDSRDLVCISNWNIKKIYKITFSPSKEMKIKDIAYKELNKTLFSLVEPSTIKYVVGIEEENYPTTINVDLSLLDGLGYQEMKECVLETYRRCLTKTGLVDYCKEPSYYVVDYT